MCWPNPTFPSLMTRYGIGGRISHGKPRKNMPNSLQCVFLDHASLASSDTSYWRHWPCSHVFHCLAGEAGKPPPGWIAHDVRVSHVRVGGSTDAVWHINHWAPAAKMVIPTEPLSREPWTPRFHHRIDPRKQWGPWLARQGLRRDNRRRRRSPVVYMLNRICRAPDPDMRDSHVVCNPSRRWFASFAGQTVKDMGAWPMSPIRGV